MPPRARPMPPDERRAALVEVTLELLRRDGRSVTTRQIAEAAGVAEGTIFRVFDSKAELVAAAMARAFVPGAMLDRLAAIDASSPFEARMVQVAEIMQQRYRSTFDLMHKMGLVRPPSSVQQDEARQARLDELEALLVGVVGPDAERLTVPAGEFVHRLRLLVFVGSHPHLADGRTLTPEQAVDTILHGLYRSERAPC